MKRISTEIRKMETDCRTIEYTFERKKIKNINLRIRHDGSIYVSAPSEIPISSVESFVAGKSNFIQKSLERFDRHKIIQAEMQYISGENVTLLGKNMRIKIIKSSNEYVTCDGIYVYINVRRPDYYNRKKNLLDSWLDDQCLSVFDEIMQHVYKKFKPYLAFYPKLKIRNMTSRWGSCHPNKYVVTLNKKLIEFPKNCIEYVVTHEFCHFIHPNHSKQFYSFLQVMLPDWKEGKNLLESIS